MFASVLVTSKPCTVMYSEFFSRMVSLTPAPAMMGAAPSPYAPMVMGASLVPLALMTRRPVLTEAPSMVWVARVGLEQQGLTGFEGDAVRRCQRVERGLAWLPHLENAHPRSKSFSLRKVRARRNSKRTSMSANPWKTAFSHIVHLCVNVRNPRTFLIENHSLRLGTIQKAPRRAERRRG